MIYAGKTGGEGIGMIVRKTVMPAFLAALAAVMIAPGAALAGSCCGGGGSAALTLPKMGARMFDLSMDLEVYDGYWGKDGKRLPDPQGSDLKQWRLNLGAAQRLSDRWQAWASLPLVYNVNNYQDMKTSSTGPGDLALGILYEAFDAVTCVWAVETLEDLYPAAYFGLTLTAPTGISQFDDVQRSFDVTGRGFYRLDTAMTVEKTVWPWTLTIHYSYGVHMERPVNREYGDYTKPYNKRLGDRRIYTISAGYTLFMANDNSLAATLGYSDLWEGSATVDGQSGASPGFRKRSVALGLALSNVDKSILGRLSWGRAVKNDGWGANFPTTDVISLGVSYVLF